MVSVSFALDSLPRLVTEMSGELKYHYSNPKFAGLPWPANKQPPQPKTKKTRFGCVKRSYGTEQEVAKEVAKLTVGEHRDFFGRSLGWDYGFCSECKAWHVVRR